MNEKNEKRRMIYFSLICIVLVIAVITATYAYFTAKKTVENAVVGETNTISFGLNVEKITTIDEKGLVPMDDDKAPQAVESMCEDILGYAVCQIYKITVNNTGTVSMYLDGYITLKTKTEDEMRFIRLYYDGDNYCFSNGCQEEFDIKNVKTGIPFNTDKNFNRTEDINALFVKSESDNTKDIVNAGETKDYYALIWLHNEKKEQNELMGMQNFFSGSVTFISAQGNEVTAIFE